MCICVCLVNLQQSQQTRKCVLHRLYKSRSSLQLQTALNPFEEQENVDARFVEETALKQTLILLGFEVK